MLDAVRPRFHEWLVDLGLTAAEADTVNARLGAYFTFALRREWAGHAETYLPLDDEFKKHENRFSVADQRERAWLRHAAYLEQKIQEPVFQESFGLAQVYVPLRAWYAQPVARRDDEPVAGREKPKQRRVVVNLRRHVLRWLVRRDPKDALRVVCGGPGSGKTSFARMLAAELSHQGLKVLYVPLHRITLRSDVPEIQAALNEFLRDRNILPHDPLDGREGEPHLVIFFDGLDELAMQGRAGQEVARGFVDEVRSKLDNLNDRERGRLVQVILGGRDIAVEAARLAPERILHVLPYHGSDPERFEAGQNLLARANRGRDRWWQKFGRAVGEDYNGMPEALQAERLEDITGQPLLNYLLALSYRRGKLDFTRNPSRNEVYKDVLDSVYERPWGEGDHPTKRLLTRDEFHELLDELGLAAWHGAGGGRVLSETALVEACGRVGLEQALERLKEGARAGAVSRSPASISVRPARSKAEKGPSSSLTRASANTSQCAVWSAACGTSTTSVSGTVATAPEG